MSSLRVGVIFGGRSGEHEVSLASAASVIAALEQGGHQVLPIGIPRQGLWVVGPHAPRALAEAARRGLPADDATGAVKKALAARVEGRAATTEALVRAESSPTLPADVRDRVDVVVVMLHGPY